MPAVPVAPVAVECPNLWLKRGKGLENVIVKMIPERTASYGFLALPKNEQKFKTDKLNKLLRYVYVSIQ
jgi:hypothetical protein